MEKPGRRSLSLEYEAGHGTLGPVGRELERVSSFVGRLHIVDDDNGVTDKPVRRVTREIQVRDAVALRDQ